MMPMQILQWDACAKTVPSLWKDMLVAEDGTFQEGLPELESPSGAWAGSRGGAGSP